MLFVQIKMQIAGPIISQNVIDFRRKHDSKYWVCVPEFYSKVKDV